MNTVADFRIRCINKFPEISKKTDEKYFSFWEKDELYPYSWFEELAKIWYVKIQKSEDLSEFIDFGKFIENEYKNSSDKVKETIDKGLIENLFFSQDPVTVKPYWDNFPPILKKLYIDFFRDTPTIKDKNL